MLFYISHFENRPQLLECSVSFGIGTYYQQILSKKVIIMQIKSKEKEFFNQWAESHEYDVLTSSGYDSIIRDLQILTGNRLQKNCRAIDLGCGTGAFTRRFFYNREADLFGLDISTNVIQLAKKKDEKIHYLVGDIEDLPAKDELFNVVIFSAVLHHFPTIERCLAEGYRVLKKGGCMLSYDPNIRNPFMWLYRHPSSPFFSRIGTTDNERLLSAEEVRKVMKDIGFIDVDAHCISGVTFNTTKSRIGNLLLPLYNTIERFMGILPLAYRYGSFLICYGKKQ